MSKNEDMSYEEQLTRIRKKRLRQTDNARLRSILNAAFLLFAIIGLIIYFGDDSKHITGLVVIGIGMLIKIIEFFIRFFNN